MAPSQLKQLKASLREHGVLGPQKSKKVRKANAKDGQKRLQRNAALEGIREKFNPFEVKAPARRDKFEVATNKPAKSAIGRPGVTRGLGEERRRDTLLKEMQSRNKVGGMLDRRFGENDPTMTPEERAAERFARQAMRMSQKNSVFNLEDDSDEEMILTHGGRSLDFDDNQKDDFKEDDLDDAEGDELDDRPTKRLRVNEDNDLDAGSEDQEEPERRKSKNEVMQEIIAKSKMYKAERQAAKADDDDLRAQLDKGMGDFYAALRGHQKPTSQLPSPPHTDSEPAMDPGRAAMLAGKSREDAEKEYEANLRQLKLEARSKPSVRTKTEEEKAAEQAAKLEELERSRLRRMRGESESSDDEIIAEAGEEGDDDDDNQDDAEVFGLEQPQYPSRPQLEVEDEDEFVLDDIVASDSEGEIATDDEEDGGDEVEVEDDGDDDFINGLVLPKAIEIKTKSDAASKSATGLAYTFPCPQTHEELLEITKTTKAEDLPTIVQRIRALYHKGLSQDNQEKIGNFANVLVQHISYITDSDKEHLSYPMLESLLRHLHSMAKTQPEDVGLAFRNHLRDIAEKRPLALTAGDMLLLTGISTIFPTSDHFHAVTTPAMLTIARYLGQSPIQTLRDLGLGAYSCSLALQYQKIAQRYVPEVIAYLVNAFAILAPVAMLQQSKDGARLNVAVRLPANPLRLSQSSSKKTTKLSFGTLRQTRAEQLDQNILLKAFIALADQTAHLWKSKSAFPEFANSLQLALQHLLSPSCKTKLAKDVLKLAQQVSDSLTQLINSSTAARKPLLLHNHRPLAIKSSIPQFIENFNPDRHYDPDRDRAELSKLKAEHKKERKGAMRELRKDANFIAREQLREKKAKDAAYEKKFSRLIAEIQGEEGREAKEYAREKARRKGRT